MELKIAAIPPIPVADWMERYETRDVISSRSDLERDRERERESRIS